LNSGWRKLRFPNTERLTLIIKPQQPEYSFLMKKSLPNQDDPKELWLRFQAGDELAFARIYETYVQLIYNYAKKFTKDEELIEDTLHNLFIYLWQHKNKLAVPLSIKFYLFSAVRRRIFKELLKRREILISNDDELEKHNPEYSVEDNYIKNQNQEVLKSQFKYALNLLSGHQRQAIELKYFDDLSCQEISGIMGVKPDNVYKLISRGLDVLKKNFRSDIYYAFVLAFSLSQSAFVFI
jgi:RNA polymerase sigma factor (sigma-70 family)